MDIWDDTDTLAFIKTKGLHADLSSESRKRILKRSKRYLLVHSKLRKVMADGSLRIIPEPTERVPLIQAIHERCGHFGVKRTTSLVLLDYWWRGVWVDVDSQVKQCKTCDMINTTLNAHHPVLQPLPIQGMFYRWHVDLAGPFDNTISNHGNKYIMVCIESFSKNVELIPIPSKDTMYTAYAFEHNVLGRYGSCAEVVTDQGPEFEKLFHELLERYMIDHRVTAPHHPQTNGLAERMVQTFKKALTKRCLSVGDFSDWDLFVPAIALGYRCSVQTATGISPYQMMYATKPNIPGAILEKFQSPIDLDNEEICSDALAKRSKALEKQAIIAGQNLKIAQHRDTLRYASTHTGGYKPKLRKFERGDYVYVRLGSTRTSLDPPVEQYIYRVIEAKSNGTLILIGKCGREYTENVSNCAPCHLPNIDPSIRTSLAYPDKYTKCEICNFVDGDRDMFLCDGCNKGFHARCLVTPPVIDSHTTWMCDRCTATQVVPLDKPTPFLTHPDQLFTRDGQRRLAPATIGKASDMQKYHGRVIRRHFPTSAGSSQTQPHWGRVNYIGIHELPGCFRILYDDRDRETMTFTELKQYLIAESELPPSTVPAAWPMAASALASTPQLPAQFDLNSSAGVIAALQCLMPGDWTPAHATKLSNLHHATPRCVTTTREEVQALADHILLEQLGTIFDPWAGTQGIAKTLLRLNKGCAIVSNDLDVSQPASFHLNALYPETYRVVSKGTAYKAIITSPWFQWLDLALPLAARFTQTVACIHVPCHYIGDSIAARSSWITELQAQGRIFIIAALPRGPMGRRCAWLLVFASAQMKQKILRPAYRHASFTLA